MLDQYEPIEPVDNACPTVSTYGDDDVDLSGNTGHYDSLQGDGIWHGNGGAEDLRGRNGDGGTNTVTTAADRDAIFIRSDARVTDFDPHTVGSAQNEDLWGWLDNVRPDDLTVVNFILQSALVDQGGSSTGNPCSTGCVGVSGDP